MLHWVVERTCNAGEVLRCCDSMAHTLLNYQSATQAAPIEPAFGDVLQELCLALVGITGDVFVDTQIVDSSDPVRNPSHCTFRVNPEASWLSSCDRTQLEDVLTSGYHFYEIDRVVQRHQAEWGSQAGKGCWKGLCLGLEGAFCSQRAGERDAGVSCAVTPLSNAHGVCVTASMPEAPTQR